MHTHTYMHYMTLTLIPLHSTPLHCIALRYVTLNYCTWHAYIHSYTTKPKVPNGVTIGHRSYQLQVIDYAAGKQNHVCRGVWSSEMHNQCDMVEMAAIIAGFTLEAHLGPQTGEAMMRSINSGRQPMRIEAPTDSYRIFSYLAAQHLKLLVEKGTFYHLAYLREKLLTGLTSPYSWTDTRGMAADGLTKGSADRSALGAIMDDGYKLYHVVRKIREPSSTVASSSHYA